MYQVHKPITRSRSSLSKVPSQVTHSSTRFVSTTGGRGDTDELDYASRRRQVWKLPRSWVLISCKVYLYSRHQIHCIIKFGDSEHICIFTIAWSSMQKPRATPDSDPFIWEKCREFTLNQLFLLTVISPRSLRLLLDTSLNRMGGLHQPTLSLALTKQSSFVSHDLTSSSSRDRERWFTHTPRSFGRMCI